MIKKVQLGCIIYLLAWMLCPPLAYGTLFRVLALFSCVAWIVFEYLFVKKIRVGSKNHLEKFAGCYLIAAIIYIGGDTLIQLLFSEATIFAIFYNNLQVYIMLIVGFIATQYVADKRWKEIEIAFVAIVVFCVVFSITATFRPSQYLTVTREAGGESKFDEEFLVAAARRGIGGFGFFCFTAILAPVLVYFSRVFNGRRLLKAFIIISAIVCEIGVISAGYTLALLISVVGIFLALFITTKNNISKIIVVFGLILILLFGRQVAELVYPLLLKVFSGSMYENKLEDIFAFLIEGEAEGTFYSRAERYLISLKSIFKYPVFGSLILDGKKAIGAHSSILDSFAAFGWIVGSAWIYLIGVYNNQVMKFFKLKAGVRFTLISLIILTGLFNRLVMTIGAVYFVVPFVAYYAREGRKDEGAVDSL